MIGDAREVMRDVVEEALANRCITGEVHRDECACPDDEELAVIFDAILAAFPNLSLPRTVSTVEELASLDPATSPAVMTPSGRVYGVADIQRSGGVFAASFFPATVLHEGGAS